MTLKVFDTHIGAQGMECIFELRHHLTPLLVQFGPSHVLVIIISNRVILFLEGIDKIHPSGSWPKNCIIFIDMFLIVSLSPIFDMRKGLKDCEGYFFSVGKILDREITSSRLNHFSKVSTYIWPSNKGISNLNCTLKGVSPSK
jgi:hypothetical protein